MIFTCNLPRLEAESETVLVELSYILTLNEFIVVEGVDGFMCSSKRMDSQKSVRSTPVAYVPYIVSSIIIMD